MIIWSGRGWLTVVIGFFSLLLGLRLSMVSGDNWAKLFLFELGLLVGAAVNQLLAMSLNSVKTPHGRRWHQGHTLYNISTQGHTGTFVVFMLIAVAVATGRLVAPLAGWGVAASAVALAVTGYVLYRRWRTRRDTQQASAARQQNAPDFSKVINAFFGQATSGPEGQGGTAPPGSSSTAAGQPAGDFSDIMNAFFGGGGDVGGQPGADRRGGNDIEVGLAIGAGTTESESVREVRVATAVACEACGATGAAPGTGAERCDGCGGGGQVQTTRQSMLGSMVQANGCTRCHGIGSVVSKPCPACAGKGRVSAERTVRFKVPGGIRDGARIRLAGQGKAGVRGGPPGDLYIRLRVDDDASGPA